MTETFTYKAFISYKHSPLDTKWSKWILRYIETYKVPKYLVEKGFQERLGKVYRDQDESGVGSNLYRYDL